MGIITSGPTDRKRDLLGLSVLCALLAWVLLQRAVRRFTYEELLN